MHIADVPGGHTQLSASVYGAAADNDAARLNLAGVPSTACKIY